MPTVLITGGTGYVGRLLARRLVGKPEYRLRLLARNPENIRGLPLDRVDVVQGDTLQPESLKQALKGVHTAFYLIHSMGAGSDYRRLDRLSAENFRDACIAAGVRRIVYLGGLGDKNTASRHLLSRIETGEILSGRPEAIQTVWFRAAVIIGAGSASFEIIFHLLHKLPIMTTPLWVRTKTQPIGIEDVLDYLESSLTLSQKGNLQVDIGGDMMSFGDMLRAAGRVMGLRRFLIPVPLFSPRLSSYWLILMTPVDFRIAGQLVEGLKSETIKQNDHAEQVFPEIHPRSYPSVVERALQEVENDQVLGWTERGGIRDASHIIRHDSFSRDIPARASAEDVFRVVIGYDDPEGWFRRSKLWKLRSLVDKLVRRPPLPAWRVVDRQEGKRLLLESRMSLPGKAWLDFHLRGRKLILSAHFFPRGAWGRLYWHLTKPLHMVAFPATLRLICETIRSPDIGSGFGSAKL